jgi:hypothetical protein
MKKIKILDNWHLYKSQWGNYKSDQWKKKSILRCEIHDLIRFCFFTKDDLIDIKNFIRLRAEKNTK